MATKKVQAKSILKLIEIPVEEEEADNEAEVKPKRKTKKSPPPEVLEPKVNDNIDPTGLYCHSCKTKTADIDLKEASCKGRTPESAERRTLSSTCKTCNKKKHSFAKKL